MSQYGAFRFGRDSDSRIATSVVLYDEATALLPEEPMYQPVIPFYPSIVSGDSAALGSSGSTAPDVWSSYPSRCDLTFYQGDDVMVPLIIEDPSDTTPDFSTAWSWTAEIRVLHSYRSTLVNTFTITDEYTPADGTTIGYTTVNLFLPRSENVFWGTYRWDLYSLSPLDVAEFPRPPDVPEPEPWPPTDQIRTWLYGVVTIVPRVTETDFLPPPPVAISGGGGGGQFALTPFFVGPNGRVP